MTQLINLVKWPGPAGEDADERDNDAHSKTGDRYWPAHDSCGDADYIGFNGNDFLLRRGE